MVSPEPKTTKTIKQYITEVFNDPYEWSGGSVAAGSITPNNQDIEEDYQFETTDSGMIIITANHFWIDVGNYLEGIEIKETGHTISIDFSKTTNSSSDIYSMTDEGDVMRTMATVLNIIKSVIKKHKPTTLLFSSDKGQNRASMLGGVNTGNTKSYDEMVKRFTDKMGYDSEAKGSSDKVDWHLTKK